MDNNNPAPSPTSTPPQTGPKVVQQPSSRSSKMGFWIVMGLVVIAVIGGVYWYLNKPKQTGPAETGTMIKQTPAPESNLDDELNSINVQASESAEFNSVDSDLKKL